MLAVLVDNHVDGDSRVQKCALAAAEAGYRVVLVGRAPASGADVSTLGPVHAPVEVRRIEAPYALLALERRVPRGRWRFPLSYATADHSARRKRRMEALNADLRSRRLVLDRQGPTSRWEPRRLVLTGTALRLRAERYWHLARLLQYRRAVQRVKSPDGVLDRVGLAARTAVQGPGAWRSLDPVLLDLELAFGPVLDELRPDLVHANDFRMSGVAVRAAARAHAEGRTTKVVYDVHEFVAGVVSRSPQWRAANAGHEAEYIRHADAVVTVSDRLAEMLRERYGLPVLPRVVLNAPQFDPSAPAPRGGVRAVCGLTDDVPLLVYGGSAAPQRGLETALDALPSLPGVHLALLLSHEERARQLSEHAARLGVADRVHVLDYVPQDQVVPFLRSATAGIIPIHHVPNHEIALITKYFEYAHAGLPIVTSDVRTMADRTRELGNGEVFRAEDVADFARAVTAVTGDPQRYRRAYEEHADVLASWSWDRQKALLLEVYASVGVPAPAGAAGTR